MKTVKAQMKRAGLVVWLFSLGLSFLTACSVQNREGAQRLSDGSEAQEIFDNIKANLGFSFGSNGEADATLGALDNDSLQDPRATIFYHTREAQGAPASSVFSISDLSALNMSESEDYSFAPGFSSAAFGLTKVDVLFVDSVNLTTNKRTFSLMALMVGASADGETTYRFSASTANEGDFRFSKDSFEATLTNSNKSQRLIVKSFDISENYNSELASSIKLTIYVEDQNGLHYVGQVSTMIGYGER